MANAQDSIISQGIVNYMKDKLFTIPDYQRAYSWKTPTPGGKKSIQNRYQVKEFWDDITTAYRSSAYRSSSEHESKKKNYYIGTIVTSDYTSKDMSTNGIDENRQNVVDGQQRIVTLYLLYVALADWCKSQGRECDELYKDSFKKVFDVPSGRWENSIRNAKRRLTLPDVDGRNLDLLLDKILEGSPIDMDELSKNNTSNIIRTFTFFRESIQDLSEDSDLLNSMGDINHPIDLIGNFSDYMGNHLYAGIVKTEDVIRAHVVFETLNDRGMPLGAEDLIKNYLFSRAGNKYMDVTHKWKEIAQNLAKVESGEKIDSSDFETSIFDKFIWRYMNSFPSPTQSGGKTKSWTYESSIFSSFKQWFACRKNCLSDIPLDDERAVDLIMDELVHAARMYTALHSGEYWSNYIFEEDEPVDENVRLIKLLKHVNSMDQQKNWYAMLYPLFFSVFSYVDERKQSPEYKSKRNHRKKYSVLKDEIMQFTHYIESYIFRSYVMKKEWRSRVSRTDKFIGLSQKIREGKYDNLMDVFDEKVFDSCFSVESTNEFRNFFSTYCIYKTGNRTEEEKEYAQFAKYILRKLENKRQGDGYSELKVAEYGQKASLEHIFPLEYSKGKKDIIGWEEFLDEKQGKYDTEYVFRVGNYTLLHGTLNSEISNSPWNIKREELKKSQIIHTAYIANTYDSWTPEVIDEVQRKLADEAVEVWNSPRDKKEAK